MHTGLEELTDSFKRLAVFYAERARGGTALIVTGGISPNNEGKLGLGEGEKIFPEEAENHREITSAVHAEGGKILLQLLHAGRYSKHSDLVAPSAIRAPINKFEPREMSEKDINRTIHDFAISTKLAAEVGYDGVEIMGSEGYLISEFLSRHTNRRKDGWGGNWQNRKRFFVDILRKARNTVGGDTIIMARMSVLDLVAGGMTGEETIDLARSLENAGANILNSGVGWHEAKIPTIMHSVPRAAFVWATKRICDSISIPIIASNRINDPLDAEKIIASGSADMVSMARPFLADPNLIEKTQTGRLEEINTCIACNQACLDNIFSNKVATCLVNPRACRELDLHITTATKKKCVAVVGAGPGGMAAAATLAERGHIVTLFESEDRIGGQFNMAMAVPGKEEYGETIRYFSSRLKNLGVDIRLSTKASVKDLQKGNFESVILATGVIPRKPDLIGIDHPMVLNYIDVLWHRKDVGQRVAIIGAGGIGFDVAEFLSSPHPSARFSYPAVDRFIANWGIDRSLLKTGGVDLSGSSMNSPRNITLCQRSASRFGRTLGKSTGWALRTSLQIKGVTFLGEAVYNHIDDKGLHINIKGENRIIEVDNIVVCAGQESNRSLQANLKSTGINAHLIGGAEEALNLDAQRAIDQAVRLAVEI